MDKAIRATVRMFEQRKLTSSDLKNKSKSINSLIGIDIGMGVLHISQELYLNVINLMEKREKLNKVMEEAQLIKSISNKNQLPESWDNIDENAKEFKLSKKVTFHTKHPLKELKNAYEEIDEHRISYSTYTGRKL
jgi:hypothetical protein